MNPSRIEPWSRTSTKSALLWREAGPRAASAIALLGLAALLQPLPSHAACQIQSIELPVKMVGSRAVAMVGINGTQVPLTVDSGAFFSILTDAAAAQLGLPLKKNPSLRVDGVTGRVETRVTTVDRLQLLKGDIGRVQFVVGGNEPGAGTMGLLGRNILSMSDTEYDLAHGVIRFVFPGDDCARSNMAYWAGTAPVTEVDWVRDYRTKVPAIRAEVKLNGTALVALLDTGATTLVSVRGARRAGVTDADLKPAGFLQGAGSGIARLWTAPFDKFELGGEAILNNHLRVGDFDLQDVDMLLGIDFFLSHRIYVSNQQSKIFFTYNGGPVFAPGASATENAKDLSADDTHATTADQFARRGAASASRNDYEHALADLDQACALDPTVAASFAQRGAIQQGLKHPAKAMADFDEALRLDPAEPDARIRRAALHLAAKEHEAALADLDILDRTVAPQAQARLAMAYLYLTLEQPARALTQLDQWLPAHPNEITRSSALNSRCWARVRLGVQLDQALDDCDDAVDSAPTDAAYLDSRGWTYLRLGKYRKAVADFDRSIEAQPRGALSLYGRGLAKKALGDAAQGDADLAAARKGQSDIDARVTRLGLVTAAAATP